MWRNETITSLKALRQKGSNKVMTSLSYVRRDVTDGGGSEEARNGGEDDQ